MSAPRDTVGYRQMNEVVAYSDDLHVWVYYDQTDDALRYEAYVVDYNHRGEPSTLAFVIDEGVLSWESALGQHFIANDLRASGAKQSLWTIPRHQGYLGKGRVQPIFAAIGGRHSLPPPSLCPRRAPPQKGATGRDGQNVSTPWAMTSSLPPISYLVMSKPAVILGPGIVPP